MKQQQQPAREKEKVDSSSRTTVIITIGVIVVVVIVIVIVIVVVVEGVRDVGIQVEENNLILLPDSKKNQRLSTAYHKIRFKSLTFFALEKEKEIIE
mmetsp:Transcript_46591/g.53870  ORF Transcript_46591/g.53870 Transcript_46591/m.53870 type:complete len:97 (+) Transcript_46591:628-918(+)